MIPAWIPSPHARHRTRLFSKIATTRQRWCNMPVITISRELGSLGSVVAEKVAQMLGYHLTDKTTIEAMLKDYGLHEIDDNYRSIPSFWEHFNTEKNEQRQSLLAMVHDCLRALAQHGNIVIVGRAGFAVLGYLSALSVSLRLRAQFRVVGSSGLVTIAGHAFERRQWHIGFVRWCTIDEPAVQREPKHAIWYVPREA